jgi:hypothetical protein
MAQTEAERAFFQDPSFTDSTAFKLSTSNMGYGKEYIYGLILWGG